MTFKHLPLAVAVAVVAAGPLIASAPAFAKSPIRVGIGDQSPRMFASPAFRGLNIRRTRYFVPSDVMRDRVERAKARAFVRAARAAGVSTLLHISTADLRPRIGRVVSKDEYRGDVGRIVAYFRNLGVRDFGAWNEVNHPTQETWDRPGLAASYFRSMYAAVKERCRNCAVVGLDVSDQPNIERYIASVYKRLSRAWRRRLTIVGIHNYSDVNNALTTGPGSSIGTSTVIRTVRAINPSTKFWFTETGALASFRDVYSYSEERQAARIRNMFVFASRYRSSGVERLYSYNWFAAEPGPGCGSTCKFDAGLVSPGGAPRPVYEVFRAQLRGFSR